MVLLVDEINCEPMIKKPQLNDLFWANIFVL